MATTATPSTWDRFKAQSWTAIGLEIAGAFLLLAFALTVMSGGEPIDPPAASSGSPDGAAVDPASLSGLLDAYLPIGVVAGILVWAYNAWHKKDKAVFKGIATGAGTTLALVVFDGGSMFLQETLDKWSLGTAETTFPLLAALVAAWFGYNYEKKDDLVRAGLSAFVAWMLTAHGTTILNDKIPSFFGGFEGIKLAEALLVAALVGSAVHLTWEKTNRSVLSAVVAFAGTILLFWLPEMWHDATAGGGKGAGTSSSAWILTNPVFWGLIAVAFLFALSEVNKGDEFNAKKAGFKLLLALGAAVTASLAVAFTSSDSFENLILEDGIDASATKWYIIKFTFMEYLPRYLIVYLLVFALWPIRTEVLKALALVIVAPLLMPELLEIWGREVAYIHPQQFADWMLILSLTIIIGVRMGFRSNKQEEFLVPNELTKGFARFLARVLLGGFVLSVLAVVLILALPEDAPSRAIDKLHRSGSGAIKTLEQIREGDRADLDATFGSGSKKTKAHASAEIGDISDSPAAERLARARALTEPDAAAADFQVGWFHDFLCTHVHDNRPGCRTPEKAAELRAIIKDEARIIQHNTPDGLRKEVAAIGTAWWRSISPGDDVKHLVKGSIPVNSVIHVPLDHKVLFIGLTNAEVKEKLTIWPTRGECQWVTLTDIADLDVLAIPMNSDVLPTPDGTEGREWTPRECLA